MATDPHCRVKRYSLNHEWLRNTPREVRDLAFADMDLGAKRVGAAIVDKWYDIDRDMEWRELSYDPPACRPTTVTFSCFTPGPKPIKGIDLREETKRALEEWDAEVAADKRRGVN